MMKEGTTVGPDVSGSPPSIKNEKNSRDPEMHGNREGNGWRAGMGAHASADAASRRRAHSMAGTATCRSDVLRAHGLPLGDVGLRVHQCTLCGCHRDGMGGPGQKLALARKRLSALQGKIRPERERRRWKSIKNQTKNIINRLSFPSY